MSSDEGKENKRKEVEKRLEEIKKTFDAPEKRRSKDDSEQTSN